MFEIWATAFGLLQSIFVLFNKRSNWVFYILQMACLLVFSYTNRLYGDTMNSLLYVFFGISGYILWNTKKELKISVCNSKERLIYGFLILIGTFLGALLLKKTNDPLPFLDSFTSIPSLFATYYMVVRKIDTWFIWFVNDIFYVIEYVFLEKTAICLLSLNVLWTFLAVISYVYWNKIMKGYAK